MKTALQVKEKMLQVDYGDLDPNPLWTTMTRQRIPVKNMVDTHLLNIIRVLHGRSPIGTRWVGTDERRAWWIEVLTNEAKRRGLLL